MFIRSRIAAFGFGTSRNVGKRTKPGFGRPNTDFFQGHNMTAKTFIRRADRHQVDNMRGFALSDSRDSDVWVADLSYGGCKILSTEEFDQGEVVELRIIKRGAVAAEVRWANEGRAGVRFIN